MALADETTRARRTSKSFGNRNGGYTATIRSTPAAEGDELKLVIPALSGEHQWTTRHWHPNGTALPIDGDTALTVVDERGGIWVLDWNANEDL